MILIYLLNYNYFEYLEEALDSLACQSDSDFSVVLVDNGSSDASMELLRKYSSKFSWPIHELPNFSLGKVANFVMQTYCPQYVVRLDADDSLSLDYVRNCKATIKEKNPDILFFDYNLMDLNGTVYHRHYCMERPSSKVIHDEALHGACTLIRVSAIEEKNGYFECFNCQDGYDLYLKMRNSNVVHSSEIGFNYRRGHRSLSSDKKRLLDTRLQILDKIYQVENLPLPSTGCILIFDSKAMLAESKFGAALILAKKLLSHPHIKDVVMVVPPNTLSDLVCDPVTSEELKLIEWMPDETRLASSKAMISRASRYLTGEWVVSVNLEELIAPVEYIVATPKLASLLGADACISGVRFDNSLYRPVVGGALPVSRNGKSKDIDRWIVHLGGVTCRKASLGLSEAAVFSVVETSIIDLISIE